MKKSRLKSFEKIISQFEKFMEARDEISLAAGPTSDAILFENLLLYKMFHLKTILETEEYSISQSKQREIKRK